MEAIAATRTGQGPEILLVHGGASPAVTWGPLKSLGERWSLTVVHRRGYPPSPAPPDGPQDFERDATDLAPLLASRPHVVAHSYGGLGTMLAAARRPDLVRSLTLIEPPLYLDAGDPAVARLQRLGDEVLLHGLDADPDALRDFLRLAGAPGVDEGPLPEEVADGVRRAHGARLPGTARPDLDALREAAIPTLVASGDHARALERVCDRLSAALGGERLVAPGAGHFVAAAPGFPDRLERFLAAAGARPAP